MNLPYWTGALKFSLNCFNSAGIKELNAKRTYMTLKGPVTYESGKTKITAVPADDLKIECSIAYDHPYLQDQSMTFVLSRDGFLNEIAPSRTFCFDYEIEALKNNGLGKGGDFSNALVVGIHGIRNPDNKLRFSDEFVRHKLLDFLGDLYLLQKPLKAHITAVRCGHNHNIKFVKMIADSLVEYSSEKFRPEETKMQEQQPMAGKVFDINAIQRTIPHRYPFLMVDRVVITEEMKKAVGYKNVSGNGDRFQGHFPGNPIMPGVLIVEAMAQTACVMLLSQPAFKNKYAYFLAIDAVKFRKLVIPGDVLELRIEALRLRGEAAKSEAKLTSIIS